MTATAKAPTSTTWQIDASHSNVEFAVRHLMISTVRGRFGAVQGTLSYDPGAPERSRVDVTIDVASVDTRVEQRDQHLRSADFFNVAEFPTMTFASRAVTARPEGTLTVTGDLTLRGVQREVELDVTPEGLGGDPWGNARAGFTASAKIRRSDFGLTWNQVLEAGGVTVSDEVRIVLEIEAVRPAAAAAA